MPALVVMLIFVREGVEAAIDDLCAVELDVKAAVFAFPRYADGFEIRAFSRPEFLP